MSHAVHELARPLSREARWKALGQRGATVWLTGLPACGKSTLAAAVEQCLVSSGRPAFVLDGDVLREGIASDLGFSAADRSENARRAAHAARMLAEAGVVALVSLISPYAADRDAARTLHNAAGLTFVEVYVATPPEECERRDPKGLWARARAGELKGFTGVDDPYEPPHSPELVVHEGSTVEQACDEVLRWIPR